jgi:hypothetical protein
LQVNGPEITNEAEDALIRYCSPVLLGCKSACMFTMQNRSPLPRLLPPNIASLVIREHGGGALLLVFDETLLEKTILNNPVRSALVEMGYPTRYSLPAFLTHLKERFSCGGFPHEVGLFLGYPLDDVRDFIRNKGYNYKLCGVWKVYNDVKAAKQCFRQYDLCRECMRTILRKTAS